MAEEAKIVDIKPEHVQTSKLPQAFSEPGGTAESITQIARRIRTELGRPLLLLAADFINNDVIDYFYKFRRALMNAAKSRQADGADIDVLIHSPGGELNSCFLIGRLLGRWLKSWEALVPGYACSGATNVPRLFKHRNVPAWLGQLGPLDPQERFFNSERRSPIKAFRVLASCARWFSIRWMT